MKSIRTRITISAIVISIIAVLLGAFILKPSGNFLKISGGLEMPYQDLNMSKVKF
jgi:hypothetical protein